MGGRHALVNHEKQMVIHQFVVLLIHLKSWKIHLILRFKQCVCNSVNFFLDHKQNKAKLSCTSHLFSWNSAIDLTVICDPDSIVRWVYTPEIKSALPGEWNWVFGKGTIGIDWVELINWNQGWVYESSKPVYDMIVS